MFKRLRNDDKGIMMNVGILWIVGSFLITLCSILYVFHTKHWLTDITPMFWTWAPVIFGAGVTLVATTFTKGWKIILIIFIAATVGYFLMQVM